MMRYFDTVRFNRVVAGAVVLVWSAAAIAGCSGNGTEAPSTATTTTTGSTAPSGSTAPAEPTEKAPRIDPGGPNPFSPEVRAPAAPTAIPGNRENTG